MRRLERKKKLLEDLSNKQVKEEKLYKTREKLLSQHSKNFKVNIIDELD